MSARYSSSGCSKTHVPHASKNVVWLRNKKGTELAIGLGNNLVTNLGTRLELKLKQHLEPKMDRVHFIAFVLLKLRMILRHQLEPGRVAELFCISASCYTF